MAQICSEIKQPSKVLKCRKVVSRPTAFATVEPFLQAEVNFASWLQLLDWNAGAGNNWWESRHHAAITLPQDKNLSRIL